MNYSECVRENLQNLFDRAFLIGDKGKLRENYRALRNIELNQNLESANERINISLLAENLTTACDILVSGTGVSFVFCGNDVSTAYGNGKALTKAILNLLSNAYLHGKGKLVTVKTVENAKHIKIEVKNEGSFKAKGFSGGLSLAHKICAEFGGTLFIETDLFTTTAIMTIKKAPATNCKDFYAPDFYEYLSDRLSPVYVEMFGMEYHN